jgi:hypothetical protein
MMANKGGNGNRRQIPEKTRGVFVASKTSATPQLREHGARALRARRFISR